MNPLFPELEARAVQMVLLRGTIFLRHLFKKLNRHIILDEEFCEQRLAQDQILQAIILILAAEPSTQGDKRKTILIPV